MTGRHARLVRAMSVTAVLIVCISVLCACAQPQRSRETPAQSPGVSRRTVLGPFPLGAQVSFGGHIVTLTDLVIHNPGTPAGSFGWGDSRGGATAPSGSRYVDARFKILSPSLSGTASLEAPMVRAAGKAIKVGETGVVSSGDDRHTSYETYEFAIPDGAGSAMLQASLEDSETVLTFRLW